LHLLWGLVDTFFGYNFPKPEPMSMKSGLETVSIAQPLQNDNMRKPLMLSTLGRNGKREGG